MVTASWEPGGAHYALPCLRDVANVKVQPGREERSLTTTPTSCSTEMVCRSFTEPPRRQGTSSQCEILKQVEKLIWNLNLFI